MSEKTSATFAPGDNVDYIVDVYWTRNGRMGLPVMVHESIPARVVHLAKGGRVVIRLGFGDGDSRYAGCRTRTVKTWSLRKV